MHLRIFPLAYSLLQIRCTLFLSQFSRTVLNNFIYFIYFICAEMRLLKSEYYVYNNT